MSRRFFGILPDHRQCIYTGKTGKPCWFLQPLFNGSEQWTLRVFITNIYVKESRLEKWHCGSYRFDFPEELNGVHDTFHVSNLKKCLADPTLQVPLDDIRVDVKLNFVEEPVEILEREFKKLKRSRIAIVKVWWNSKRGPEFTWERADR
ncbi:hypothetical protein Tco_1401961 [Tanacetum coccineum]